MTAPLPSQPRGGPRRPDRPVEGWLAEHGEELVAFRRHLHAHPELSGDEHATTELVLERLRVAGLHPRPLSSGTGLICDLDVGARDSRPALALRADLDALAMADEKDVPYRSQVSGVSHACGHDVHTAIVLGTALYFSHHPQDLPGPLRFLFQPAEERVPGGALDVIADGGLTGVDAVLGLHCEPKLDLGQVGLREGPISSAADMVCITLLGEGGHTARPELTVDLVPIAARVILELPALVQAKLGGAAAVRVGFGSVHAGDAANVIPTRCELRASVRTPAVEVWEALPAAVDHALTEILAGTSAGHHPEYIHGVPPVVNDADLTGVVRRAATRELGRGAVTEAEQSWGGDDFAWYTREVPGTYVRLGVHDPRGKGRRLDLHAGHFDVDERAIAVGVRLVVAAIHEYFAQR